MNIMNIIVNWETFADYHWIQIQKKKTGISKKLDTLLSIGDNFSEYVFSGFMPFF